MEPRRSFLRRHWGKVTIASVILVPALVFTIWAGIALSFTYSSGDRVGYVQKLSRKGWICKTWEGELSMVTLPGQAQERWTFSVRDDSIANVIRANMGSRVTLDYEEHRGVPTACFGETQYFIVGVRPVTTP